MVAGGTIESPVTKSAPSTTTTISTSTTPITNTTTTHTNSTITHTTAAADVIVTHAVNAVSWAFSTPGEGSFHAKAAASVELCGGAGCGARWRNRGTGYCCGARCEPLFAFGRGRLNGVTCEVKGSSALFARGQRSTSVRARSPSAPVHVPFSFDFPFTTQPKYLPTRSLTEPLP